MNNNKDEHTIAKRDGKWICIAEVKEGDICTCPECGEELVAKNHDFEGRKKIFHFAHKRGNCKFNDESAIHKMAKEVLMEEKRILLPKNKEETEGRIIDFENVICEEQDSRTNLRPDCIGVCNNGRTLWIEFRQSHEVDADKTLRIIKEQQSCIEIDLRECKPDKEMVRKYLLEQVGKRIWVFNKKTKECKKFGDKKVGKSNQESILYNSFADGFISEFEKDEEFYMDVECKGVCINKDKCKFFEPNKCMYYSIETVDIKSLGYNFCEKLTFPHNGKIYHYIAIRKAMDNQDGILIYVTFDEYTEIDLPEITGIYRYNTTLRIYKNEDGNKDAISRLCIKDHNNKLASPTPKRGRRMLKKFNLNESGTIYISDYACDYLAHDNDMVVCSFAFLGKASKTDCKILAIKHCKDRGYHLLFNRYNDEALLYDLERIEWENKDLRMFEITKEQEIIEINPYDYK